jgi:Raf kinase inhibitor-like YbhB/YbcL family protein
VPDGTVELAVVLLDRDATDAGGRPFVQWLVTGIDASVSSFAAGSVAPGATVWPSSFGEAAYGGPCPPAGEEHRYELTVHALNQPLDAADDMDTAEVVDRIGQRSVGSATVAGTFTR